jgi:hypothetical protein
MLPGYAFSQSASQICIPKQAFDGLVEDSFLKTQYEELYKSETDKLNAQLKVNAFQKNQIDFLTQQVSDLTNSLLTTDSLLVKQQASNNELTRKINSLKTGRGIHRGIIATLALLVFAL